MQCGKAKEKTLTVRKARKTILFVNRVAPPLPGATGRMMQELSAAFNAAGWHADSVTMHNNKKNIAAYCFAWARLLIAAMARRADVIVLMTDPPFLLWFVFALKIFRRARVIHWCHDLYPQLFPVMGYKFPVFALKIMTALSRRAYGLCDAVVTIGDCMKNKIPAGQIHIIPNWAPLSLQPQTPNNGSALRLLYAGNMGRNHPLQSLIDAADHFQTNNPDPRIEFLFSGSGQQYGDLVQQIGLRQLKNCRILEPVPEQDLGRLLAEGDLHVTTMNEESGGLLVPCKIYSAAAIGRPALFLGPDDSEASRFLARHSVGWTLPAGDTKMLIEFLKYKLETLDQFHDAIRTMKPYAHHDQSMQSFVTLATSLCR